MPVPFPPPDLPSPPPRQPSPPSVPITVPLVDTSGRIVRDGLADQRRILVSGPLDHAASTTLAAQLMAFDGASSRDVEILISSPGGPVPDLLPILDVLDLMRARVNVTAIGSVGGTAVGLVAAGTGERRAAAHARFSLRLDTTQAFQGTADELARHADLVAQQRTRYLAALAASTGCDEEALAGEVDRGRMHTAEEVLSMGIVDTIAGRA